GEDRDHHPAQEVAALRVVGLGDRLLQALEGSLRIALVPGGEAALEPPGAVASIAAGLERQPGPRGQALRLEVPAKPLEHAERLRGLTASEQHAAKLDRGLRVAGIELQGPAQRWLVVGGGELVGGRRNQLVQEALDLRRRDRADELGHDLPVAK